MEEKVATVSIEEARRILKAVFLTGRSPTGEMKDVYAAINKYLEIYPNERNRSTFRELLNKIGSDSGDSDPSSPAADKQKEPEKLPSFTLDGTLIKVKAENMDTLSRILNENENRNQKINDTVYQQKPQEEKVFDGEKAVKEAQENKENYLSLKEWERNRVTGEFGNDLSSSQLGTATFGIKKLRSALRKHDYDKAESIRIAGKRIRHKMSDKADAKEQAEKKASRIRFIAAQRNASYSR